MQDSILLRTLRKMTPRERQSLCKAVRHPLWNLRPDTVTLCDALAAALARPGDGACSRERIWAAFAPGQPLDEKRLYYATSWLLDATRRFLAELELEADQATRRVLLLRALRRRGMDDLFDREQRDAGARLQRGGRRDAQYHYARYLLQQEHSELETRAYRTQRLNFQPLADELSTYFAAELLRHACSAQMHEAVAPRGYRFSLLPAVLDAAEAGAFGDAPAVALFFHAYRALEGAESHFRTLLGLMDSHWQQFNADDMRGMYLLTINFCIRRMNAGESAYVRQAFDLYRAALDRNLLAENGHLTGFTYKNIVRIATALGETEWAARFLDDYKKLLHPRERENAYRYNLAFLYFQQAAYARVLPLLQTVELDDRLNNLDARRMLLRSYFELGEWPALDSLLDSFTTYIHRQKDLGYHRENYLNLIRFVKKLLELQAANKKAGAALRKEIEATALVAEKKWLLEKIG